MTKGFKVFFSTRRYSITPVLQGPDFQEILAILIMPFYCHRSECLFWAIISIFVSAVQKKSRGPEDHGFKMSFASYFFNLVHHLLLARACQSGSGIKKMPIQNRSS
jgi:hypothetical protein